MLGVKFLLKRPLVKTQHLMSESDERAGDDVTPEPAADPSLAILVGHYKARHQG